MSLSRTKFYRCNRSIVEIIFYLIIFLMFLRELFKNALLDWKLLSEWANRFLSFYMQLRFSIIISILILLIIYAFWSWIFSRKFKFSNSRKESFLDIVTNIKQNKQKFKPFVITIKHMIIWLIIIWCARFAISYIFFSAGKYEDDDKFIGYTSWQYTTLYQENINKWLMLTSETISQHKDYLWTILGNIALYMLLLILLWTFFYTFSFCNKFIRNIGILIWIFAILLFFVAKLLNYYNI